MSNERVVKRYTNRQANYVDPYTIEYRTQSSGTIHIHAMMRSRLTRIAATRPMIQTGTVAKLVAMRI